MDSKSPRGTGRKSRQGMFLPLEPRILLDAAGAILAADLVQEAVEKSTADQEAVEPTDVQNDAADVHDASDAAAAAADMVTDGHHEIAFVDTSVPDAETLIAGLPASVEIYRIDSGSSGLTQMNEILAGRKEVEAIHILSHGSSGALTVGTDVVTTDTLEFYRTQLSTLGSSLTADGDILLYGCDIGRDGAFVERFSEMTGADVAASDDATGASELGGDWALEAMVGTAEASVVAVLDYQGVLSGLEYADLSTWGEYGADLDWVVQEGSRTVVQSVNGGIGYFLNGENAVDIAIQGEIKVGTPYDNDVVGFILGYSDNQNYVYFGWDQGGTRSWSEGLTDDKELGIIINGEKHVLATSSGQWSDYENYLFKILYMSDGIKVEVNGSSVFNVDVSDYAYLSEFSAGWYGFYNYSQGGVTYGNIKTAPGSTTEEVPTVGNDTYGVTQNTTLDVDKYNGILSNDYDGNLDEFSIKLDGTTLTTDDSSKILTTSHGSVTLFGDGHFSYSPTDGYTGTDSFTYTLVDNDGESSAATVTFSVSELNVAPTDISASSVVFSHLLQSDGVVATLSTTDANSNEAFDYIIVSQTTTGMFKIVDGVLKVSNPSGIVSGEVYDVAIKSTDLRGLSITETLRFTPVNDAPEISFLL